MESGKPSTIPLGTVEMEGASCSSRRRLLWFASAVCSLFGIAGWVFYGWALHGDPGQDWMVFYTAARAYLDGNLPLIFDGQQLTAALNQRFSSWMSIELNLHPWVYPPSFLLLFLPFGLLPPGASLTVFELSGFAAALTAATVYAGRGLGRWLAGFSLLLCPAVPFNVMTGQNAFFTSALLIGGFGLLGRNPLLGGALLGVLTYKPQMWLMVPFALVAARQWRALASAVAMASLIALLSLVVFGSDIWRAWIELMSGNSEAYRAWVTAGRLNGVSVFACASLLGAPPFLANLAQGAAVAIAGGCVYWVFRRCAVNSTLALSCVLAASTFAAPHASTSDYLLIGLAAALFLACLLMRPFHPIWGALAATVWISPLFNPPSLFRIGLLTPLLILLLLAAIIAAVAEENRLNGSPNRLVSG
jgi:alpha-1,2-mannosyltransferase